MLVACAEHCAGDFPHDDDTTTDFERENGVRMVIVHSHHAPEYALEGWSTKPEADGSISMFCPHLDWSGLT